jgi:hypothetical protein
MATFGADKPADVVRRGINFHEKCMLGVLISIRESPRLGDNFYGAMLFGFQKRGK